MVESVRDITNPLCPQSGRSYAPTSRGSDYIGVSEAAGLQSVRSVTDIIGWILQGGVLLSTAVIVLGLFLLVWTGGLSLQRAFLFPGTLGQVEVGLLAWQPQAIIMLGLLLLIATPVIRVATSMIAFALERDRKYVIITFIVLVILLFSLLLSQNNTTTLHLDN